MGVLKCYRTVIVGAGKGGTSLLGLFCGQEHEIPSNICITGVVDVNPLAPGIELARKYKIPVYNDIKDALKGEALDIVINVTGKKEVTQEVLSLIGDEVTFIDGNIAFIISMLIERYRDSDRRLKLKLKELEDFYNLSIDRENKMVELKKKVNELSKRLGIEPPYDLSFLEKR